MFTAYSPSYLVHNMIDPISGKNKISMGLGLTITVEELHHKLILRLEGRLDAVTSHILEKKLNALIAEHHHQIILDFFHVHYLSSAGLRLLLSYSKVLKTKNGGLILVSIDEEVMEIIKLAGFESILLIFKNEQDAFKQMKP